jgi:hypothetical protein
MPDRRERAVADGISTVSSNCHQAAVGKAYNAVLDRRRGDRGRGRRAGELGLLAGSDNLTATRPLEPPRSADRPAGPSACHAASLAVPGVMGK